MDGFEKRGKYWYKLGNNKHPYEPHKCEVCSIEHMARRDHPGRFCSKKCAQSGVNNSVWKGDDAGYLAQHQRVYTLRGKADSCVWGCQSEIYDWANLTGRYLEPDDYAMMCRACHAAYDGAIAKCFDKTCKQGHTLNNSTMYVRIRNGKEVRQCKQCAKDRAKKARNES